jgi:hypothetical protein
MDAITENFKEDLGIDVVQLAIAVSVEMDEQICVPTNAAD